MQRIYPRCAGIDVHKDSRAVCIRVDRRQSDESYGTTSREILRLGDRLAEAGVEVVAMEATGVYWKPVWNLLEGRFELVLANPRHIKRVPGRKTDVTDAQWIAQLLEHGLIEASFEPPPAQRQLRDLTRQRSQLLADRARVLNRVHKVLESANLKVGSVMSDIGGVSGRKVLHALAEGKLDVGRMAELVDRRMEDKTPALREALQGWVEEHHRFMLRQLLEQVDHLDRQVDAFDLRIEERRCPRRPGAPPAPDAATSPSSTAGWRRVGGPGGRPSRWPTPCWWSATT
jgi:transposase